MPAGGSPWRRSASPCAPTRTGCARSSGREMVEKDLAASTRRWRRARSSSCAAPTGAGPRPSSRSAPTWRARPRSSPSATSTWRTSAPGATATAAWCGASTTSTRRRGCPTRSISCAWRPAPCWQARREHRRDGDLRGHPRGLSPGLGAPQADRARPRLGLAARAGGRLREARAKFWSKIEAAEHAPAPPRYGGRSPRPCRSAHSTMRTARRTAGTGSLGRPRWIGVADWQGAPVVREVKVVLARLRPGARARGQRAGHPLRRGRQTGGSAPTIPGIGWRTTCSCAGCHPTTARSRRRRTAHRPAHARHAACHGPRARQRAPGHRQPARRHPARPRRAARPTGCAAMPSGPPPPSPATTRTGGRRGKRDRASRTSHLADEVFGSSPHRIPCKQSRGAAPRVMTSGIC